ncbi:MAG: hypothetical protein AAGM67_18485, partial [Bacteroidota bacterium]
TPREGKTIFSARNRSQFAYSLYLHDNIQNRMIDSMRRPIEERVDNLQIPPVWLDDHRVMLYNVNLMIVADFETDRYEIIRDWQDCKNYEISSVAPLPNHPNEILYVLNQFYYDEEGEYRKRHDLVHLDLNTGEENMLLIDF